MADTSQEDMPPQTNGMSDSMDEDDRTKMRPADIDADVREMERRKRVELIMNSKLFREELERIIEVQLKDGSGTTGLMQQISDMMGVSKNSGHVFKNSNCVVPINDIRGIEAMGYAKGEKILRCKLAAVYRLIDLYGWSQGCGALVTARLNQDDEHFLANPYGMLFHEMTASGLIKIDMQGNVIEQGTTNFGVNITAFSLHAAIHSARPDIKCIIHVHTPSVVAISAIKCGLLPISEESVVIGDVSTHPYMGGFLSPEEIEKIARNLGPNNKVLLLTNQGAVCCGETIEEAFFNAKNTVLACESQLKLMPVGLDNLVLISDETRKKLYEAAHRAPESTPRPDQPSILEGKVERKWRVGGVEFEALMRMLDNAGFRTGYIYRHPLVKGEPPKPKNDVEVPPAVSSLGYLLEEEELYKQGLWKKLEGGRKGHDRSRWLNSPNVYQKVEILETGTPDPRKITKWITEPSPTHSSTPVKIESALQFVPKNTNPKEFKQLQQQIKDYRRADKISAGPQSHILEGVTWEEARKMQDATVTQTGDQVVLMGAASKGIIQRGFQHNATMYKSPYAKNPFDSITDEELDEYKKVVEKKSKGDFDDTTDYSESEGLSSAQINKRISDMQSPTSVTSETEEESRDEPQVLRIETRQAPKPSQPEVVLSDDDVFEEPKEDAFEKIKTAAMQQSPVSIAPHVNSVKRTKAVRAYRRPLTCRATQQYYRTNSYAGLPKGSYTVPNPKHYHIVRYTNTVGAMRPALINIVPKGRYAAFNPGARERASRDAQRPTVTINIGNAPAITLDISMQTLREFIYPFASALNLESVARMKSASCQTSYVTTNLSGVSITELNGNGARTESERNESSEYSEFEMDIVKKMREDLRNDVGLRRGSNDFNSASVLIDEESVDDLNEEVVDDESANERNDVPESTIKIGGSVTENPTVVDANKNALKQRDFVESEAEEENASSKHDKMVRQKNQKNLLLNIETPPAGMFVNKKQLKSTDIPPRFMSRQSDPVVRPLNILKQLGTNKYPTLDHYNEDDFIFNRVRNQVMFSVNTSSVCTNSGRGNAVVECTCQNCKRINRVPTENKSSVQKTELKVGGGWKFVKLKSNETDESADVGRWTCDTFYRAIGKYIGSDVVGAKRRRILSASEALVENRNFVEKLKKAYCTTDMEAPITEEYESDDQSSEETDESDVETQPIDDCPPTKLQIESGPLNQELALKDLPDSTDVVDELASEMKNLWPSMKDLWPEIKDVWPVIEGLEPELKDFEPEIKNLVHEVEPERKDLRPQMEDFRSEIKDLRSEVESEKKDMRPDLKDLGPEIKDLGSEVEPDINNLGQDIKDLGPKIELELKEMVPEIKKLGTEIKDLGPEMKDLGPEPEIKDLGPEVESEIKEMVPETKDLGTEIKDFGPEVEDLAPEIKDLADKVTDSAMSISTDFSVFEDAVLATLELLKQLPFNGSKASENLDDDNNLELDANVDVDDNLEVENFEISDNLELDDNLELGDNLEFEDNLELGDNLELDDNLQLDDNLDGDSIFSPRSKFEAKNRDALKASTPTKTDLKSPSNTSRDEGIDCRSLSISPISTAHAETTDKKILEMSDVIFDYLVKQCFELRELVLFPEVMYDENVTKMYNVLKDLYARHYPAISDDEKSELRINIASCVLSKVEIWDANDLSDSDSSYMVSDKIFTISEFVSDILDNFFERFADANGADRVVDNFDHSTPAEDETVEDLTLFRTKRSVSGNELYWITIDKSPKDEKKITRNVVNVDDIPLKPPPDLDASQRANHSYRGNLSPILEEPRCDLFGDYVEDDFVLEASKPQLNLHIEAFEYRDENFCEDVLAGGDYFSFERPQVNEVTFLRSNVDPACYSQSSNVTFVRSVSESPRSDVTTRSFKSASENTDYCSVKSNEEDEEDEDEEGNWMGYEGAKF